MKDLMKVRPSPAMVVALISLFVALGGTAAALSGSNTVFSDDIVNNAVRSADVRDDTLTNGGLQAVDLRPGSVGGSEVANNSLAGAHILDSSLTGADISSITGADVSDGSLTGADIDEGTLGQVPSALLAQVGGFGRWTGGGRCDPEGPTIDNYLDCAIVTLNLPVASRVLLGGQATALVESDASVMSGRCQLVSNAGFILPQSAATIQSTDVSENVSLTGITGVQSPGSHDYAVDCSQGGPGAIRYIEAGISAVAIAPD